MWDDWHDEHDDGYRPTWQDWAAGVALVLLLGATFIALALVGG